MTLFLCPKSITSSLLNKYLRVGNFSCISIFMGTSLNFMIDFHGNTRQQNNGDKDKIRRSLLVMGVLDFKLHYSINFTIFDNYRYNEILYAFIFNQYHYKAILNTIFSILTLLSRIVNKLYHMAIYIVILVRVITNRCFLDFELGYNVDKIGDEI